MEWQVSWNSCADSVSEDRSRGGGQEMGRGGLHCFMNSMQSCNSVTFSGFISWKTNLLIIAGSAILPSVIGAIILGKMHFLLISENLFFYEVICDGRTSFMDFIIRSLYEVIFAVCATTMYDHCLKPKWQTLNLNLFLVLNSLLSRSFHVQQATGVLSGWVNSSCNSYAFHE